MQTIANNNLNIPLISSSRLTIFESAKGSIIADDIEYIMQNVESLIIGIIHIPIITIVPTIPTAFFKISPHPNMLSTPSPITFPNYWN